MADAQKKIKKIMKKNAESLPFIEGNVFTMFQAISSSGSLTKKILTFKLHNFIPTDGAREISLAFEISTSHVESTDSVPPISSSSDAPRVSNRQPDLEEEECARTTIWKFQTRLGCLR